MAGKVPNHVRDDLITAFRYRLCAECLHPDTGEKGIWPFRHQAEWWSASDGVTLLDVESPSGMLVGEPDGSCKRLALAPRPGGRARVLADLGSFKIGKSYGAALWTASFAAVPSARVQLVGIEYDTCAPEFEYICEFLLSSRGLNLPKGKGGWESLQNRPRDGRMWLDLHNGARFEARSWERKDAMKGKEIDAYLYCEAYMLPGLECYTDFSQNLHARNGYAVFATTPDRPWVKDIHDAAHSGMEQFKAWHCTCSVPASVNVYTYNPEAEERDKELMPADKWAIKYKGALGEFVGSVFDYQRGQFMFSPRTHPELFPNIREDSDDLRSELRVPDGWDIVCGADTGTFTSGLLVAFSPEGEAFVLDEFPNYKYVASTIELDKQSSIPAWAGQVALRCAQLGARPYFYADKNSQFKHELTNYGIHLLGSSVPVEARTEITREYFVQHRVWLAPWLRVLPFEVENAQWPEEASASGKFARVKDRDHTLDCLEHVLSRRPRGRGVPSPARARRWLDEFAKGERQNPLYETYNPHTGRGS